MTSAQVLAALRAVATVSVVDGKLSVRVRDGVLPSDLRAAAAVRKHELVALLHDDPVADGRDIVAALVDRGISVRLDDDGRPWAGPVDLIDDADRALLAAHRDAVLAALRAEVVAPSPALERHGFGNEDRPEGVTDAESRGPGSDSRRNASTGHGAVHIDVPGDDPSLVDEIAAVLVRHPGSDDVLLHFEISGCEVVVMAGERFRVAAGTALMADLDALLNRHSPTEHRASAKPAQLAPPDGTDGAVELQAMPQRVLVASAAGPGELGEGGRADGPGDRTGSAGEEQGQPIETGAGTAHRRLAARR
jgi:hypothetical protein